MWLCSTPPTPRHAPHPREDNSTLRQYSALAGPALWRARCARATAAAAREARLARIASESKFVGSAKDSSGVGNDSDGGSLAAIDITGGGSGE